MLFTVGHTESYERYFKEQSDPRKLGRGIHPHNPNEEYSGGSVYLTLEEALSHCPEDYSVYGLMTTLDNTYERDGSRYLINSASLIRCCSSVVEHSPGKGEVVSSILTNSTSKGNEI